MGLVCHAKKHKSLVELWKDYQLWRGIIRVWKIILSFKEWLSEQDQRQRDLCNRDRKRVKIYNPLRS